MPRLLPKSQILAHLLQISFINGNNGRSSPYFGTLVASNVGNDSIFG